ncbi:MAG: glycosyl hydrolase family 25 [Bacteroidaceae bacterium]|nr:glycosyl hydrolase family 25 [Bacteroidaceae bacterium]
MKKILFYTLFLLSTLSLSAQELCEDTCSHVHGIDISHYQGNVFWEHIGDNSKMAYVYIKCTEGGDNQDPKYLNNIELAKAYGLKVGSYHFYRPKTPQHIQLQNFMAQCKAEQQDLLPMIDIESAGGYSASRFCDSLFKFIELVEEAIHQKPLLYTYKNFYNNYLLGKIDGYPLMIACYTDEPPVLNDEKEYCMWQYTAKGTIRGIRGYVDKSRFMGNHSMREIRYIKD